MARTVTQFNARQVMNWLPVKVADLLETRCREHIEDPEFDIDVAKRTHFDEVEVEFKNGQRIIVRFYVLEGGATLD